MGLGLSLFFVGAGAILAWAVTATTEGIDLDVVGYIVLGIGCFGVGAWLVDWLTGINRVLQLPAAAPLASGASRR
ncbi:MAG: hypothetical protein ACE5EV_03970 [Gaiellales bacterium]